MKKQLIYFATLILTGVATVFGQVGIGTTDDPKSTLHISENISTNDPYGFIMPNFTVTELAVRDAVYGVAQNGTLLTIIINKIEEYESDY